jgi:hypothetical protein
LIKDLEKSNPERASYVASNVQDACSISVARVKERDLLANTSATATGEIGRKAYVPTKGSAYRAAP